MSEQRKIIGKTKINKIQELQHQITTLALLQCPREKVYYFALASETHYPFKRLTANATSRAAREEWYSNTKFSLTSL